MQQPHDGCGRQVQVVLQPGEEAAQRVWPSHGVPEQHVVPREQRRDLWAGTGGGQVGCALTWGMGGSLRQQAGSTLLHEAATLL